MKAVLVEVSNVLQTRTKLPSWTTDDPDKIIDGVQKGIQRVITQIDCDKCKADLEQNDGANVEIGK